MTTARKVANMDALRVILVSVFLISVCSAKSTHHAIHARSGEERTLTHISLGPEEELSYPETGGRYPDYADRTWLVEAPQGSTISVNSIEMNVEYDSGCSYDYVRFIDPNTEVSVTLCGDLQPTNCEVIGTTSNQLRIEFHSDGSVSKDGFTITLATAEGGVSSTISSCAESSGFIQFLEGISSGCPTGLSSAGVYEVTSPNYPTFYDPDTDCTTSIQVDEDKVVAITIDFLEIEDASSCVFDYLSITESSADPITLCGYYNTISPPCVLVSSSSQVSVQFHSDGSVEGHGFHLTYEAVSPGTVATACDLSVGSSTTSSPTTTTTAPTCPAGTADNTITSPNYPGLYSPYAYCSWRFTVPDTQVVALTIDFLEIEYNPDCSYDALIISEANEHPIALCGYPGDLSRCVIVSSSNEVTAQFHSDYSIQYSGFSLSYSAVSSGSMVTDCGQLLGNATSATSPPTTTTGAPEPPVSGTPNCPAVTADNIITSPNYPDLYLPSMDCAWSVAIEGAERVQVIIQHLSLEQHSYCGYDYLRLSAGSEEQSLCGSPTTDGLCAFVFDGNTVDVTFHSDGSIQNSGFQLQVQALNATSEATSDCPPFTGQSGSTTTSRPFTCEPQTLTDDSGTITSPNATGTYPNSAHCQWTVQVDSDKHIAVNVQRMSVEGGGGCSYDKLKLTDGEDNDIASLCGEVYNLQYTISSSTLHFVFTTDSSVVGTGFVVQYAAITPGEDSPFAIPHTYTDDACGLTAVSLLSVPDARIVGGHESDPNAWPWMLNLNEGGSLLCGAAVLSRTWAITAAHCVYGSNAEYFSVTAGDHILRLYEGPEQTIMLDEIIANPNYNPSTVDNDVALLKLSTPLSFNDHVRPVCLSRSHPTQGSTCVATGWGSTQGTASGAPTVDNVMPAQLNEVELPLVSNSVCNQNGWLDGGMTGNMFCAGLEEGGVDTCQGDSGGPFMCDVGGKWVQSGVTSWGLGCAERHHIGVYTKLDVYSDWIEEVTGGHVTFV